MVEGGGSRCFTVTRPDKTFMAESDRAETNGSPPAKRLVNQVKTLPACSLMRWQRKTHSLETLIPCIFWRAVRSCERTVIEPGMCRGDPSGYPHH